MPIEPAGLFRLDARADIIRELPERLFQMTEAFGDGSSCRRAALLHFVHRDVLVIHHVRTVIVEARGHYPLIGRKTFELRGQLGELGSKRRRIAGEIGIDEPVDDLSAISGRRQERGANSASKPARAAAARL
jgi:hypothetical protein